MNGSSKEAECLQQ